MLALQSDVARAIAQQIRIAITPVEKARLSSSGTVHPEAYAAYLKGRHHWNLRTFDGLNQSIRYFEEAIAIDPTLAQGYAGLADAFNMLGSYSYLPPKEMLPKAGAMARQALALDSGLAEAHTALAGVQMNYQWDWEAAEKSYRRAIELNPGYPTAHQWYSQLLIATGRAEESFRAIERALLLDPFDLDIIGTLARNYYFARQYDRAIEQCLKTIEIDDRFFPAYVYLGLAYTQQGRFEEAIPALQTATQLSGDNALVRSSVGYAYGLAGREKEARDLLGELQAAGETGYIPAISLATIHAGLGELDAVFADLEQAYDERHHYLIYFKVEPLTDLLQGDPRFADLLAKMNLD